MRFRKDRNVKQVASPPRRQIDPALEYRSAQQRKAPSVLHLDFGVRLEFDYVPIEVDRQRYYLTSLWLPDELGCSLGEVVDASGEYHSFPRLKPELMPDEVTDAIDAASEAINPAS